MAQKLQSSLAVEGELPEGSLTAYGDDGDDLMLALARKIVPGEEDAGSVESVFEQAGRSRRRPRRYWWMQAGMRRGQSQWRLRQPPERQLPGAQS